MDQPTDLPLLDTQQHAIEELENLITSVRSGSVVEVISIAFAPNDQYKIVGGAAESKHRMAGLLLDAAITRLGFETD